MSSAGKGNPTITSFVDELSEGIGHAVEVQVVRLGTDGYFLSRLSLSPVEAMSQ